MRHCPQKWFLPKAAIPTGVQAVAPIIRVVMCGGDHIKQGIFHDQAAITATSIQILQNVSLQTMPVGQAVIPLGQAMILDMTGLCFVNIKLSH